VRRPKRSKLLGAEKEVVFLLTLQVYLVVLARIPLFGGDDRAPARRISVTGFFPFDCNRDLTIQSCSHKAPRRGALRCRILRILEIALVVVGVAILGGLGAC